MGCSTMVWAVEAISRVGVKRASEMEGGRAWSRDPRLA